MNNNLWYTKSFEAPIVDENYYYIVVAHDKVYNKKDKTEVFQRAARTALNFLLQYYNLKSNNNFEQFLFQKTSLKEWYLAPNYGSKIKCLIQIDKKMFHEIFNINEDNLIDYERFFIIKRSKIREYFDFLINKIEEIDKEYKIFIEDLEKNNLNPRMNFSQEVEINGVKKRISTVFDADLYIQDIKLFKKNLLDFIYENKKSSYIEIKTNIKKEDIVSVEADNEFLQIGNNVYLDKLNSNKKLIRVFSDIEETEFGDFYLKDSANWKDFLYKYLDLPLSFALFQDETIQGAYTNIKNTYETIKSLPGSVNAFSLPGKIDSRLKPIGEALNSRINFDAKLKKVKDREKIFDPIIDNVVYEIQTTYPTLETLEEIYDYIVNKISIEELIAILLKCLKGFGFNFNFSFSFDFKLPQLPRIDIYDLYLFLEINLEEIFIMFVKYLIDQLFGYLLDLLREFCENLWKPSLQQFPDLVLDDTVMPDYGDINELIKDFIKDLLGRLTPNQICGLLSGEPTNEVLEIIFTMLEEPKYFLLKEKFKSKSDILLFFKSMAAAIDISKYCNFEQDSSEEFPRINDPCVTREYFESFMKQLYSENHSLSDEEVEELLRKQREKIANLENSINNFDESFKNSMEEQLASMDEQEIEIAGGEKNPYNSLYNSTIKTLSKNFSKNSFSDELKNFNIYNYSVPEPNLAGITILDTMTIAMPTVVRTNPIYLNIIEELRKSNPATNSLYSFGGFYDKLSLDYTSELSQKYKVLKKKINQIKTDDPAIVCKQIRDEYIGRMVVAQDILYYQPLPLQISLSHKFPSSIYASVTSKIRTTKLSDLVRPGETLSEYIQIFELISNYFRDINVGKDGIEFIKEKIAIVEDQFKEWEQ